MKYYTLEPRDPLVVRDNRPIGIGTLYSAGWIHPSVMAGSLRTAKGKSEGRFDVKSLQAIAVAGPFPLHKETLAFEPPADAVALESGETVGIHALRPRALGAGEGCDLPSGLQPCVLAPDAARGKPVKFPGFWSLERMTQWLLEGRLKQMTFDKKKDIVDLPRPVIEERTHVVIDPKTGTASDGGLFVVQGLSFRHKHQDDPYRLSVRISDPGDLPANFAHPVGGERRVVQWNQSKEAPKGWECPDEIVRKLCGEKRVRLVLATPALFKNGWMPGWMDVNMTGNVPGTSVKVKLVAACVPRWEAISGWSFERKGPKPIRRMTPAGSVYFLEIIEGDASELAKSWLEPMSDLENAGDPEGLCRNDGFGLALWGIHA